MKSFMVTCKGSTCAGTTLRAADGPVPADSRQGASSVRNYNTRLDKVGTDSMVDGDEDMNAAV